MPLRNCLTLTEVHENTNPSERRLWIIWSLLSQWKYTKKIDCQEPAGKPKPIFWIYNADPTRNSALFGRNSSSDTGQLLKTKNESRKKSHTNSLSAATSHLSRPKISLAPVMLFPGLPWACMPAMEEQTINGSPKHGSLLVIDWIMRFAINISRRTRSGAAILYVYYLLYEYAAKQ